ncbi:hypothetical protein LEP1GSC061_3284 [Leptospira wolffii serovar Khorat str. Khorat-H2]|nr:hypothetical protein LEP1GSC061_3284 [Leptospira wolffii serovar Khorat str. Khorat-H2]
MVYKKLIFRVCRYLGILPILLLSGLSAQGLSPDATGVSSDRDRTQNAPIQEEKKKWPFHSSNDSSGSKKPEYFSIYPGVNAELVTVDITGNGHNATMTRKDPANVSWMLDLKSKEIQLSQWMGIHFLIHNSEFYLNNQFVEPPVQSQSGSSEGSDSGNSGASKQDVGTRMRGQYSMFIPILYFGKDEPDSFRLGIGAGPANVRLTGSVDFMDPGLSLASVATMRTASRAEFLDNISAIQFLNGNVNFSNGDPIINYLLANLSQGNNLELLGAYYAYKGLLSADPLYLLLGNQAQYTPLELATISSLARSQVNVSVKNAFSFMIYFETGKIGPMKFRLAFGGPLFKENGYTYEFRTFQLSAFMPIEF